MVLPQPYSNRFDPLLLPVPLNQTRTLNLTHPMLARCLNQLRQLQRQRPIVEGIIRFGKLPFRFDLAHDVYGNFSALTIRQLVLLMMQDKRTGKNTRYGMEDAALSA